MLENAYKREVDSASYPQKRLVHFLNSLPKLSNTQLRAAPSNYIHTHLTYVCPSLLLHPRTIFNCPSEFTKCVSPLISLPFPPSSSPPLFWLTRLDISSLFYHHFDQSSLYSTTSIPSFIVLVVVAVYQSTISAALNAHNYTGTDGNSMADVSDQGKCSCREIQSRDCTTSKRRRKP